MNPRWPGDLALIYPCGRHKPFRLLAPPSPACLVEDRSDDHAHGDDGDQERAGGADLGRHPETHRGIDPHRGRVGGALGPVVKLAMTRSSSDRVKESIQPGHHGRRMIGSVIRKKASNAGSAEVQRRLLLDRTVEGEQARLHHHRHEKAHGQRLWARGDGPAVAGEMSSATNRSSSERPVWMTSGMTSGA